MKFRKAVFSLETGPREERIKKSHDCFSLGKCRWEIDVQFFLNQLILKDHIERRVQRREKTEMRRSEKEIKRRINIAKLDTKL